MKMEKSHASLHQTIMEKDEAIRRMKETRVRIEADLNQAITNWEEDVLEFAKNLKPCNQVMYDGYGYPKGKGHDPSRCTCTLPPYPKKLESFLDNLERAIDLLEADVSKTAVFDSHSFNLYIRGEYDNNKTGFEY